MNNVKARGKLKITTVAGLVPTVPASNDHTDGTWYDTDIYIGELFLNTTDNILYSRNTTGIIIIAADSSNIWIVGSGTGSAELDNSQSNDASGSYSVAGGSTNTTSGLASTAFGFQNVASGHYSTALGNGNTASGEYSLAAGLLCVASGDKSIAFGSNCEAQGVSSAAIGTGNVAKAINTVALGQESYSDNAFSQVLSSGKFDTTDYSQVGTLVMKVETTDDTQTALATSAAGYFKVKTDHSYHLMISLIARRADGSTAYIKETSHCLVKDISGTTSIVDMGQFPVTLSNGDSAIDNITATVSVVNPNELLILVTGRSGESIRWTARIDWVELGYAYTS